MGDNVFKTRWVKLEKRALNLTKMMDELDEVCEHYVDIDIKTTTIYMMLDLELKLISEEQKTIEESSALSD